MVSFPPRRRGYRRTRGEPNNWNGERFVGTWNNLLKILLRLGGSIMGLAILAVFMPSSWMQEISVGLGFEALPNSPLSQYLTRSLSLMYFVHGVLLLVAAQDTVRMAPMITAIATLNLVLAVGLGGIDLWAGMPIYWTIGEVLVPAISGLLILFIQSRARRELAAAPGGS